MRKALGRFSGYVCIAFLFQLIAPATAEAKQVFYLDLKKGCYAGNSPVRDYLEWSLPEYKRLYTASCYGKYHYQVYSISKLTTQLSDKDATQKQANNICKSAALNVVGNKKVSKNLSYAWFFPDQGQEETKYGKKLICFFRMVDSKDYYLTVAQTSPMP